MDELTVRAPAISCGHCARAIQEELGALAGISGVVVDVATKTVTVRYASPATEQVITRALGDLGYPVEGPS